MQQPADDELDDDTLPDELDAAEAEDDRLLADEDGDTDEGLLDELLDDGRELDGLLLIADDARDDDDATELLTTLDVDEDGELGRDDVEDVPLWPLEDDRELTTIEDEDDLAEEAEDIAEEDDDTEDRPLLGDDAVPDDGELELTTNEDVADDDGALEELIDDGRLDPDELEEEELGETQHARPTKNNGSEPCDPS